MTRLVRASELIGMPLITLDTADLIGEVRDVLTDPQAATVAALTVRGRGLLSPALIGVLPFGSVHAIGRDSIIVAAADAVLDATEPAALPSRDGPELIGRPVVTAAGDAVGTVSDLVVEVDSPVAPVVGFEIERGDGQRLLAPLGGKVVLDQDPLVIGDATTPASYGLTGLRRLLERIAPGQIAPV